MGEKSLRLALKDYYGNRKKFGHLRLMVSYKHGAFE